MNAVLSPSLAVIEESLYGPSDALLWKIAFQPETVSEELRNEILGEPRYKDMVESLLHPEDAEEIELDTKHVEMPEKLRILIEQKVEAIETEFDPTPRLGQLRLVEEAIGPNGPLGIDVRMPLAVCLNHPYEDRPDVWMGWLVTPETDYAGYWDILLDEQDRPVDPLCGMVRTMVPVMVYLPSAPRVIGQLSAQRMDGIAAVVRDLFWGEEPTDASQPGTHITRTVDGHTVVTGTPLGGEEDPRWEYNRLYKGMLPLLEEPADLALAMP